ncbi:Norsolorinic acid ketoreductase [Podospora australis]|uniref:Norsolorinic acid ketoreductase n=1 Tax=Podospora australis TaxID=1536484 RepID=A0AAN6WTW0_9PEZI|nr:Norsolorinic acid ketoreductase [Podospora australis]
MAENTNTVYLITGANRGIGLTLTTLLLHRPGTTVVATARRLPLPSLDTSSIPASSKLIPILLDESRPEISSATLIPRLVDIAPEIPHINVVIANAGTSTGFKSVRETSDEDILGDFTVNTLGPVRLFRACWPLLQKAEEGKKLVLITSSMGSISMQEPLPGTAYGISKAALNWWGKKASEEYRGKGLVVGVLHPGWVKTKMGQDLADAVGFPEPPLSAEESARAVLAQIDGLDMEKSGKFLSYDGQELSW